MQHFGMNYFSSSLCFLFVHHETKCTIRDFSLNCSIHISVLSLMRNSSTFPSISTFSQEVMFNSLYLNSPQPFVSELFYTFRLSILCGFVLQLRVFWHVKVLAASGFPLHQKPVFLLLLCLSFRSFLNYLGYCLF